MNELVAQAEVDYARRIGLFARNLVTGRMLVHRPDERFVMCSTFKVLAATAVLDGRLLTPDRRVLERPAYWPPSLVAGAGYADVMQRWQRGGYRPTVAEVCEAAVADSDNAAGNWLLGIVGGPTTITRLAGDLGDRLTALTRWEPDLNDWAPGSAVDTTTPRAMGRTYATVLLTRFLDGDDRELLTGWLLASRTGGSALRAGLPPGWRIAEKTGSGAYGARNDVGVAWTPTGEPVVISCFTHGHHPDDAVSNEALARVADICARALG